MKKALLAIVALSIIGCVPTDFYKKEAEYNYPEAYQLCQDFKEGILIVQLPCLGRKFFLMQNLAEAEENPKKKARMNDKIAQEASAVRKAQQDLILAVKKFYTYSDFAFVPDTLLKSLKNGNTENIFLDDRLKFYTKEIADYKTMLTLRGHRDFDNLYVYQMNGDFPPDPFPYSCSVSTGEQIEATIDTWKGKIEQNEMELAIYLLQRKLERFYRATPPVPSQS